MICFAWGLKIATCFQIESYRADGELQARECLNVTDTTIDPPSPVILEASVEGDFICKDKPPHYFFSCTLYGKDLIWYFNNELVPLTSFHITHNMSRFRIFQYPPYYSITVVLTQVSNATISRYNARFFVSMLTVQPYNESDIQVLPFTVSCQTHCPDDSAICQTKHYDVAGKLNKQCHYNRIQKLYYSMSSLISIS